jgi:hypothetical protein
LPQKTDSDIAAYRGLSNGAQKVGMAEIVSRCLRRNVFFPIVLNTLAGADEQDH